MRETSLVEGDSAGMVQDSLDDCGLDVDDGRVILVKVERGMPIRAKSPENTVIITRDGRMVASFAGPLSNEGDELVDENRNVCQPGSARPQLMPQPTQRQRRQILASLGQPPRAKRLAGSRRGMESRSLDRGDSTRPSVSSGVSDDDDIIEPSSSDSTNKAPRNDALDSSAKYRDDCSRREFIEKLRHFERLTVQPTKGEPVSSSTAVCSGDKPLATNNSSCQSVPLARRPPPPPPSAPPKPPYQPHPEIENRLRFFDTAFGRHSNLRDRRLENLVSPSSNSSSSNMSASVSSAVVLCQPQRLGGPSNSADDSAVIYSPSAIFHQNPPDVMSYSMTADSPPYPPQLGTGKPAAGGSRIDVLNRISTQLLLSTSNTAVSSQVPSPSLAIAPAKPKNSVMNTRLQATEAELRRELEHLDLMLNNIKENSSSENGNGSAASNGTSTETSPLASLARDRRHSAGGAMSSMNNGPRISRIQTVTVVPPLSRSVVASTTNQQESSPPPPKINSNNSICLIPANLRAEIQNYRRSAPVSASPLLSTVVAEVDQSSNLIKEVSSNEQVNPDQNVIEIALKKQIANSRERTIGSNSPVKGQLANNSDRSSPLMIRSDLSHSPSPSPPNNSNVNSNNSSKPRRVVFVRAKIPSVVSPALNDHRKLSSPPQQLISKSHADNNNESSDARPTSVDTHLQHVTDTSMLSPSSSASSSNGMVELSSEEGHPNGKGSGDALDTMPPPPTPSPPSRDNLSSDSSTPPPQSAAEHEKHMQHLDGKNSDGSITTTITATADEASAPLSNCFGNNPATNGGIVMTAAIISNTMAPNGLRSMTPTNSAALEQLGHPNHPSPNSLTPSTSNSDSNSALASVVAPAINTASSNSNLPTSNSGIASPLISVHKQHQQILRDISTLRHCLIDIETQQQNILQEVSALRAEATAVHEVESIREAIRAAELRFELERERATARLVASRNKVHLAARELQHLEQQRLMTTPANGEDFADDEGDEAAVMEARQQLETLQDDVADADFELVEAETRYESERERLLARLSAATEAAASASMLAKNGATAGLIGGTASYDYWIRRLTEHYRQLDGKRQLIERNLVKLQAVFNNNIPSPAAILPSNVPANTNINNNCNTTNNNNNNSNCNGDTPKDSISADCSLSIGGNSSSNHDKDISFIDGDSDKRSVTCKTESDSTTGNTTNNTGCDTNSCSDGAPAESSSTASRPASLGDDQQSQSQNKQQQQQLANELLETVSSPSVRLRQHKPTTRAMIAASDRPRTLFLPQPDNVALDLREHLDALSHDWRSCSHVTLSSDGSACRGWLHKLTSRLPSIVRPWSRRWFVFDRQQQHLFYCTDTNEGHSRGQIPFAAILDVYVETASSSSSSSGHRTHRPPNSCSNLLIVVQTVDRRLILAAPSPQAARIWVDVLCTGAAGNQSYEATTPPSDSLPKQMAYECATLPLRS